MSRALPDSVAAFIERHALLEEGATVLVGVSGGMDSMVCLALLRRLGYDVHALHVNYGLREGADADEQLVRRWCAKQSPAVPLVVRACDANARAEAEQESLQEAARRLRYDALADQAQSIEASAVATGHHRDDQAETLLLNLVRGAGPEGLAGMRPSRPLGSAPSVPLIRPLLAVERATIEKYAEAEGIPWRTDPTNRSLGYDRGVVRTKVLPLLEEHFEGASDAIVRAAGLMQEYVDETLRPALEERMEQSYADCPEGGWLDLGLLRDEPAVWRQRLVLEALRRALPSAPQTAAVAEEIAALADAQVGRRIEFGAGTIWREREGLRLLPTEARPEPVPPTPVPWEELVGLPDGVLEVERLADPPASLDPGSSYVAYADADRLGPSLHVRTWRDGDRLRPLGVDGTKSVSDVLTDAQVPPHRRDGVYVLCTDEHVAWVVGHRLDARVRVRPDTERVARLVFRPGEKPSDD